MLTGKSKSKDMTIPWETSTNNDYLFKDEVEEPVSTIPGSGE